MPKVNFIQSLDLQANYICFLASQIQAGIYQKHGFLVLPNETSHPKTVYFPDFPYSSKFWKLIQKSSHKSVARFFPKEARDEILQIIPSTPVVAPSTSWSRKQILLLKTLKELGLFQKELKMISSIAVLLTPYGTIGSFHHIIRKSGKIDIFITQRLNNPIEYLIKTIILALLLIQNPRYAYEQWQEKQNIADFLLSSTKLVNIFPPCRLAPVVPEKLPAKYLLDSQKYLRKLSFDNKKKLKIVNDRIYYGDKNIDRILSPQEKKVLIALIIKGNKIIIHDELAKVLWKGKADEKFSLWAITKLIQKIRTKLKSSGINTNVIYTVYSRGYGVLN
jgi:hypothetical protein